jgi:hypothetical protein
MKGLTPGYAGYYNSPNKHNMHAAAVATAPSCCSLIYNMGDLGGRVFNFESEAQAAQFLQEYPPDHLVQSVYRDNNAAGVRDIIYNPFFSPAAFNRAVEEKRWEDGYYRRTGRRWKDCRAGKEPGDEVAELDHEACLRLLGLTPGFTQAELATAYRAAIKMNHPDKVAALADAFRLLAEQRTRQINEAYAKLQGMRKA